MKFVLALNAVGLPTHELVVLARAAEKAGYAGVTLPDHVVIPAETGADVYQEMLDPKLHWPDCLTTQALLLGATTTLRVITDVLVLPTRNPLMVAKAMNTMEVMTPGRAVLGVGAGWFREEFAVLGVPFETRGARMDEAIEIIRRFTRDGEVTWRGRHFDIPRVWAGPVPNAPTPIYIGGMSEAAMRRAARVGDGFLSMLFPCDDLIAQCARVNELRAAEGREGEAFEFIAVATDAQGPKDYLRMAAGGIDTAMIHVFDHLPGGVNAALEAKLESIEIQAERLVRALG